MHTRAVWLYDHEHHLTRAFFVVEVDGSALERLVQAACTSEETLLELQVQDLPTARELTRDAIVVNHLQAEFPGWTDPDVSTMLEYWNCFDGGGRCSLEEVLETWKTAVVEAVMTE
jgi:hypothetical protein